MCVASPRAATSRTVIALIASLTATHGLAQEWTKYVNLEERFLEDVLR